MTVQVLESLTSGGLRYGKFGWPEERNILPFLLKPHDLGTKSAIICKQDFELYITLEVQLGMYFYLP